MTHHLWIDPRFGASGDMVLGAFIALGVETSELSQILSSLRLDDVALTTTTEARCGLVSTKAHVHLPVNDQHHRSWTTIDQMIASAKLPATVSAGARRTFRRLAEVESAIHQTDIDEVHFHEVGALDAIVDIVGAWVGWHLLGEPTVSVGSFGLGHGTVQAAHGTLPLPAPAVLDLLNGWSTSPVDAAMETVTPTGAALLRTLSSDDVPALSPPTGVVFRSGRGAGGKNPAGHPNVVTAVLVETGRVSDSPVSGTATDSGTETMVELSTNVDDVTAEVLAYTIERCLETGAADAWTTPITMKKGRSAQLLSVLCAPEHGVALRKLIMTETGSLGVRHRNVERFAAPRRFQTVDVRDHQIRVKIGPNGAKPEFDDCAAAARALGLPLRQIQAEALVAL